MPARRSRKDDHLDLCGAPAPGAAGDVSFREKTTLLEDVDLLHDALPDLALADVDLSTDLLGKRLRAPLLFAAMTGGVPRAQDVNLGLAAVAEGEGLGFATGSMRPLLEQGVREGFFLREAAPTALILGNLGVIRARDVPSKRLASLVRDTGVDALCLHLNPAMEAVQAEGDRDFRGGYETIRRLVADLPVPVVVKETGSGISRDVAARLVRAGVRFVDVVGAGGTSWVGVETRRASGDAAALGERFWDWGIPTAASLAQVAGTGLVAIATGGIASGLDVAKAAALGATAAGVARPWLVAWNEGGADGVARAVRRVTEELRLACLLTGSRTPADLATKPLVLGPRLRSWLPADSPLRSRTLGLAAE
jgi:isopentenyl-diphosphate delta-isomerase